LTLAAYLLISIIAFSFVFEHWTIIDSMYFAVVTFTTTGYGDISPSTASGKLFCVLFALSGVAVLAIALGVVGSKIVEAEVLSISAAEAEIVKDVSAVFHRASKLEKQKGFADSHRKNSQDSSSFSYLTDYDDPTQSFRDRFDAIVHPCLGTRRWCTMFLGMMARYLPALAPLFLGSFIIGHYEGWNWEDTIYYCVVTTTTIGYGDLTPQQQSTKLFAVLFIPLAVGAMGHFLGTVANFIMEQRIRVYHKRLWRHELTLEDLRAMSSSPDGTVTELDFLVFMLQAMKKVDCDLINKIREHFHNLDLTHSGTLVRRDLELMAKRKLRTAHSKLHLSKYKSKLLQQASSLHETRSFDDDARMV
jgi:potassium channel subfamily K